MQRCALGTTVKVNRIIITTEDKLTDHSQLIESLLPLLLYYTILLPLY